MIKADEEPRPDSSGLPPEDLVRINRAKSAGKKIGFACGIFDLFHAGHVLMLQECKEHCDFLIVAINRAEKLSSEINPGKKIPLFSFEERKLIMENSKYVDIVVGYSSEEELRYLLKNLGVDVRFLGEDYRGKPITGADPNIKIHYTNRNHGWSTSLYRKRIETMLKDSNAPD